MASCKDCGMATKARCQECGQIAWGNGIDCWKCHDARAHRVSRQLAQWADAVTLAEIALHSQFPIKRPR